jgi:hypothetical protein
MIATNHPVEMPTPGQGRSTVLWADDAEAASYTHDVGTYRATVEPSVWVVEPPFSRDVLVAACMTSRTTSPDELVTMSTRQVRAWALGNLLFEGVSTAKRELESAMFTDAYRAYRADAYRDDPATAPFFALACARIDRAFGFNGKMSPLPTRPVASISATGTSRAVPTDIRRLCTERKWSRSRLLFEMRRTATASGIALPGNESLRRMVRTWANGHRGLSQMYVRVLSDVFTVRFEDGSQDVAARRRPPIASPHTTAPTVRAGLALAEVA